MGFVHVTPAAQVSGRIEESIKGVEAPWSHQQ